MSEIPSGLWRTAGGSTLLLHIQGQHVTGTYVSIHGQPPPDHAVPIVGFVNGGLIAFVASWGAYDSMTSWTGRIGRSEDGKPCLHTSWTLVRKFADRAHRQENEFWESFITYAGTYHFIEALD